LTVGSQSLEEDKVMKAKSYRFQVVIVGLLACVLPSLKAAQNSAGAAAPDYIQGTVTSSTGPEAGVWVIAETKDLPTKLAKIVVTDDKGKYVSLNCRAPRIKCGCGDTGSWTQLT